MNHLHPTPKIMSLLCSLLLLLNACSKDADLLSDYVIAKDGDLQSIALLVDDRFFLGNGQTSIVMDVLNNDSFNGNAQVTIVETSTPQNGEVVINSDNTLTYSAQILDSNTPEDETEDSPIDEEIANAPIDDSFTYTTEVITEENEVFRQEATVSITSSDMGELKAFPGAEGFGKYTTGGRGGVVYRVTNLNDSGYGSLRYGVESLKEKRTIVFDISGYINLQTPLMIRQGFGNITIAGQTAPGNGITLRGASIWIQDSNVIIRYIKVRPGLNAYNPSNLLPSHPDYEPDDGIRVVAVPGHSIENIIIDHCTVTWAHDGLIDITSPSSDLYTFARNITIQNCLLAENIDKKYGVLINHAYDVSFYKNIIAFTIDRNIAISSPEGKGVEMVNNLVYCTDRSTWYREGNVNDFIGNSFISGPRTRQYETFKMELSPVNADITKSSIYLEGNIDDGANADNSNNSRATPYIIYSRNYQTDIPIENVFDIEDILVNDAGSSLFYDSSDLRIMNSIKARSGNLISSESEVGGYPNIGSVTRSNSYDTDRDGMADNWEIVTFGDLSKTSNGDENSDGYTNLETFLNFLVQ